jgi:hypothetical protein
VLKMARLGITQSAGKICNYSKVEILFYAAKPRTN